MGFWQDLKTNFFINTTRAGIGDWLVPDDLEPIVDSKTYSNLVDKHRSDVMDIAGSDSPADVLFDKISTNDAFRETMIDGAVANGLKDPKAIFSGIEKHLSEKFENGEKALAMGDALRPETIAKIEGLQAELGPQLEVIGAVNDLMENKIVNNLANKSPEEMKEFLNDATKLAFDDGQLSDADLAVLDQKHEGFIKDVKVIAVQNPEAAQDFLSLAGDLNNNLEQQGVTSTATADAVREALVAPTQAIQAVQAFNSLIDFAAKDPKNHLEAGQKLVDMMGDQYPGNLLVDQNVDIIKGNEELMTAIGADLGANGAQLKQLLPGLVTGDKDAIETLVQNHPEMIEAAVPIVAAGDPEMSIDMASKAMENVLLGTIPEVLTEKGGASPEEVNASKLEFEERTAQVKEFVHNISDNPEFRASMIEKLQDPEQAGQLFENMRSLDSLSGDRLNFSATELLMEDMKKHPDEVLDVIASKNYKAAVVYRYGDSILGDMIGNNLLGDVDEMLENLRNSQIGQMFPGLVDMLEGFLPQLQQMLGGMLGGVSNIARTGADYMVAGGISGGLQSALGGFGGSGTLTMANGQGMFAQLQAQVGDAIEITQHNASRVQELYEANYIGTDPNGIKRYDQEAIDKGIKKINGFQEDVKNAPPTNEVSHQSVDPKTGNTSDVMPTTRTADGGLKHASGVVSYPEGVKPSDNQLELQVIPGS